MAILCALNCPYQGPGPGNCLKVDPRPVPVILPGFGSGDSRRNEPGGSQYLEGGPLCGAGEVRP